MTSLTAIVAALTVAGFAATAAVACSDTARKTAPEETAGSQSTPLPESDAKS